MSTHEDNERSQDQVPPTWHTDRFPSIVHSGYEAFALRARTHGERVAVCFPEPSADGQWHRNAYTFADCIRISDRLAAKYLTAVPHRTSSSETLHVALLCPTGPDFLFTLLACWRLGLGVVFIAPAPARKDSNMPDTVARSDGLDGMSESHSYRHPIGQAPPFQTTRADAIIINRVTATVATGQRERDDSSLLPVSYQPKPALVFASEAISMSSSGSTGMPKPIRWPHSYFANVSCCASRFEERDDQISGSTTMPLYHAGFFDMMLFVIALQGYSLFPLATVPLTARNLVAFFETCPTSTKELACVPIVIKMLYEANLLGCVRHFRAIITGGGPLDPSIGDSAVLSGVPLVMNYGAMEIGCKQHRLASSAFIKYHTVVMNSWRDFSEEASEWQWLRKPRNSEASRFIEMRPFDDRRFELVILPGWPIKAFSNRAEGAYAPGDLFEQHPEDPNKFRFAGRANDILIMSTGEKADPTPLESHVRSSPLVEHALVFGSGRQALGLLVLFRANVRVGKSCQALVDLIWPNVNEANLKVPTHARILRELVVPLMGAAAETGFPMAATGKGTIQRPQSYELFAELIDVTYERFETVDVGLTECPDEASLRRHLKSLILTTMGSNTKTLHDDTDLYIFGVDSLHAMRIRNVLQKRLDLGGAVLQPNVVYDWPTISLLTQHLVALRKGQVDDQASPGRVKLRMQELIQRYRAIDSTPPTRSQEDFIEPQSSVIVLTGATGFLGAHVLSQALKANCTIFCLVRAASNSHALQRVQSSLTDRRLPTVSTNHFHRFHCLAARLSDERFGLDAATYATLERRTTCILHVAWSVNFAASLMSFDENISGLQQLARLALSGARRPSFVFVSTIAAAMGMTSEDDILREAVYPDGPVTPMATGYAQAKWVAERLCEQYSLRIPTLILRVGQLCGDTESGVWNRRESWPLLIASARVTGGLPLLNESLSWLPVDIAAKSILEIIASAPLSAGSLQLMHVANSSVSPTWQHFLRVIGDHETIPVAEWLDRLRTIERDLSLNPGRQLLEYWRRRYLDTDVPCSTTIDVSQATRYSNALRLANQPLSDALLLKIYDRLQEADVDEYLERGKGV